MAKEYPWWEVVQGGTLEQGDILMGCPVVILAADLPFPLSSEEDIVVDVAVFDLIVMTQSCDLENQKLEDVIVCPHWDLNEAGEAESSLAKKKTQQEILKGRRPRYSMLEASHLPEVPMGIRVVDFGRVFSLPKSYVCRHAESQGSRLRLSPPYREHLSQSFARFFMRVGLPQNIDLA